jgi:hypothetical protein
MQSIEYSSLFPTGDVVSYDDTLVIYPEKDVVSIFGPIFTPRIHSKYMDTLELASSGKVALTLADQHALDIRLDESLGAVEMAARNGNSLSLVSEEDVSVTAGSNVSLACDAGGSGNVLSLGAGGIEAETSRSLTASAAGAVQILSTEGPGGSLLMGAGGLSASTPSALSLSGGSLAVVSNEWEGLRNSMTMDSNGISFSTKSVGGVVAFSGDGGASASDSTISMGSQGISFAAPPGGSVSMTAGGEELFESSFDDVEGRYRVSFPSLSALSGFDSDRLTSKISYHASTPARPVRDGAANDSSGIRVSGSPAVAEANHAFFDKSFLWRTPDLGVGADGMFHLAKEGGHARESYWDLRGGSFRMTNVNTSSGDELSFAFRFTERDELELVKRVFHRGTGAETFETVTKFGQNRSSVSGGALLAKNRGSFTFDGLTIAGDLSTVAIVAKTFNMYSEYDAFFALVEQTTEVTTAELLAMVEAGGPGTARIDAVAPNAIRPNPLTFASPVGGGAFLPGTVYAIVAVIKEVSSGLASIRPARQEFFMVGTDAAFFSQTADLPPPPEDDPAPLSVASPAGLTIAVNSQDARVAIPNATAELVDYYMTTPTVDSVLHPDNKTTATLCAWLAANYSELVPFVPAIQPAP